MGRFHGKVLPRLFFKTIFAMGITEIISGPGKEKTVRGGLGIDFHMTDRIFR
jgi:hypothetical protein